MKIILANEITAITHGKDKATDAQRASEEILSKGWTLQNISSTTIKMKDLNEGIPVYKIFAFDNILCKSNSEARRLIKQGGAKLNGIKITDENMKVNTNLIGEDNSIHISAGTKRHALIKIID